MVDGLEWDSTLSGEVFTAPLDFPAPPSTLIIHAPLGMRRLRQQEAIWEPLSKPGHKKWQACYLAGHDYLGDVQY